MSKGWRSAFIRQGISDFKVFERLCQHDDLEQCHTLHYLQMATEKLSKGLTLSDEQSQPFLSHKDLVKWIRTAKVYAHRDLMDNCHIKYRQQFCAYLDGLIPIAQQVESLAPAVNPGQNTEYPWLDLQTGMVLSPAEFFFKDLALVNPMMVKLLHFIRASIQFSFIQ